MERQIITTEDGSSTLYIPSLKETYHSHHGALQESLHVFIEAGLVEKAKMQQEIAILEIGFGTGLNAILTAQYAQQENLYIRYTGVEAYPVEPVLYLQMQFGLEPAIHAQWLLMQQATWNESYVLCPNFKIEKQQKRIETIQDKASFDIIYFDAFSPEAQPELWTETIFQKMYDALKPQGILVTYCAKGVVKRTMKAVGFEVERLPGAKGKREMTRARKV